MTSALSIDGTIELIVDRAYAFLSRTFRAQLGFNAVISATPEMTMPRACPDELFSSMVILAMLRGKRLEPAIQDIALAVLARHLHEDRLCFFKHRELLPPDVDCTALGLSLLLDAGAVERATADAVATSIVENVDQDGVIRVYFASAGQTREHVDAVVCANALYLLYQLGRESEAEATAAFLLRTIDDPSYLDGTRYYPSPDALLCFIARLVKRFDRARERFAPALARCASERRHASANALDRALRIVTARAVGQDSSDERACLFALQRDDGGFDAHALFRAGKRATYFGSRALTTAIAVAALEDRDALPAPPIEQLSYYVEA